VAAICAGLLWAAENDPGFQRSAIASPTPIPGSATVLTVNGVGVPLRELRIYLVRERSTVLSGTMKVPAPDDARVIYARARADAIHAVVQFQLAEKYGLVHDDSYGTFLSALRAENTRRAEAVGAGKPIYGPESYSEADYLDYVLGNYAYTIGEQLASSGAIPLTAAGQAAYFGAHKSSFTDAGTGTVLAENATQVHTAYIMAEYSSMVRRLEKSATVSVTASGRTLETSGCIVQGNC
jgi:hypothetical protein